MVSLRRKLPIHQPLQAAIGWQKSGNQQIVNDARCMAGKSPLLARWRRNRFAVPIASFASF